VNFCKLLDQDIIHCTGWVSFMPTLSKIVYCLHILFCVYPTLYNYSSSGRVRLGNPQRSKLLELLWLQILHAIYPSCCMKALKCSWPETACWHHAAMSQEHWQPTCLRLQLGLHGGNRLVISVERLKQQGQDSTQHTWAANLLLLCRCW